MQYFIFYYTNSLLYSDYVYLHVTIAGALKSLVVSIEGEKVKELQEKSSI
jgi:hypothetical protein